MRRLNVPCILLLIATAVGLVSVRAFGGVGPDGYPYPPFGTSAWHLITTGVVKTDAQTAWAAIEDPRAALSAAFRQYAFEVLDSGSIYHVILNSGEEIVFTLQTTDESNRYHHLVVFGHTQGIFNVEPSFVNIRQSELFIQVKEIDAYSSEIAIGLYLVVDWPAFHAKLLFFLHGFLKQLADHFQMAFGVGDCVPDYRREILGVCNNLNNPTYGASETALGRLALHDPVYVDGMSIPANDDISARHISNIVCAQGSDLDDAENALHLSDLFVFFGQFIDHDIGITPFGSFSSGKQPLFSFGHEKFRERFDIPVPEDDPNFTGPYKKDALPFERSIFVKVDGLDVYPRVPPNAITAYLDSSQVYGADRVRAKALRAYEGGKLKISGEHPGFLPFNGDGEDGVGINLENAQDASSTLYVAGDIRAQENVVLASLHALFVREHNRLAKDIADKLYAHGATEYLTDEILFQFARAVLVAEYQSIVYAEWLPFLLGEGEVEPSDYVYNYQLPPTLTVFFTTAAFRFGHSMVNNFLLLKDKYGAEETMRLETLFFTPNLVDASNFASYLFGAACHEARELDCKVVDALRVKLFTKDDKPSEDLVSLNIQRGRDHGIPDYNKARIAHYLPPATTFADINYDNNVASRLSQAYNGDISKVDAFVGGLCEKKPNGRLLGDLFHASVKDHFTRLRDGDRFFYKAFPFPQKLWDVYGTELLAILNDEIKIEDLIVRNTELDQNIIATYGGGPRDSLFKLNV